ncbi:MAG: ATP-binding protein [Pontimonas sp.]
MRRIFLFSLLGVSLVALLLSDLPFGLYLYQVERDRLLTQLQRDAFILGGRAEEVLEKSEPGEIDIVRDLAIAYREGGGARVIITDEAGIAVITNDPNDSREGLDYSTRPEIAEALTGRVSTGQRFSETLQMELVFVAVPVYSGQHIVGAVRLTFDVAAIDEAVNRQLVGVYLVALVTLLFAIALALVLSRVLSRNLRNLGDTAEALSRGDLTVRAPEPRGPREVRELAQAFNIMARRLQLLVDEQKAFAADASHQLRTPLTALQLRIDRLRESLGTESASSKKFDDIEREIYRMRRLIEGLLALGRASSEDLAREKVDVAAVIRERVDEWTGLAEENGATITLTSPESVRVLAVPTAVEQIIDNYIDNALSALDSGTSIEVSVSPSGNRVTVDVADDGKGISPDDAKRAFDRFWRGKATHQGTGLGLAIVRQLAEASGAEVKLIPRENRGTIARVTFESA